MASKANWLFIDLNSYFAGIEQELQPALRGRPMAVIPVQAETTCCIAVSYQAKAYGIRTGLGVAQARVLCPHLAVVEARPRLYVEFHHRILAAIERCVPVQAVLSCDEFACRLLGREREPQRAVELAYAIKQEIRAVGSTLRCSIGIAPNRFLAKVAADMQKPDGLMVFDREHLPTALHCLDLGDVPGIGRRMEKRIRGVGITTMQQLCGLSRANMNELWGGVWGDRLWLWLRGEDFLEPPTRSRQTLSRQHILPPHCRNRETARGIAIKMLLTTARKMRGHGLWATGVSVTIGFQEGKAFELGIRIAPSQDVFTLQAHMAVLFDHSPALTPSDLTVVLWGLVSQPQEDLFTPEVPKGPSRATEALDALNLRFGLNTVYPGSIHAVRKEAPTRIPFGPPQALEEYDDPADLIRPERKGVRRDGNVMLPDRASTA